MITYMIERLIKFVNFINVWLKMSLGKVIKKKLEPSIGSICLETKIFIIENKNRFRDRKKKKKKAIL